MVGGLLIIGSPEKWHIGAFFSEAANELDIKHQLIDMRRAWQAPKFIGRFWWKLLGHRPFKLLEFSREVFNVAQVQRPSVMLAIGICPITVEVLKEINHLGILTSIFLTDDPWSKYHRSDWFFRSIRNYGIVFTPRRSNINDLKRLGCKNVEWLPFAYSPYLHYLQALESQKDQEHFLCDVALLASADPQRAKLARTILESGLDLKVYGGLWERYLPELGSRYGGMIFGPDFRKAIIGAKINICPVRHCNRDGHVMRTYEIPACGGAVIMEDTDEHRELFGQEGKVVLYYSTGKEAVNKALRVIETPGESERLQKAARGWILRGANTYKDRLLTILGAKI